MSKFKVPFEQIIREKGLVKLPSGEFLCDAMHVTTEQIEDLCVTIALVYDEENDLFYSFQYNADTGTTATEPIDEDLLAEYREGREPNIDSINSL